MRISLVGFDAGLEATRTLDGHAVTRINADLTSQRRSHQARRLGENSTPRLWATPRAAPSSPADVRPRMLAAPRNPTGRPNAEVVRPWVNGLDITRRPRGMYHGGFRCKSMPMDQAAHYELPFHLGGTAR